MAEKANLASRHPALPTYLEVVGRCFGARSIANHPRGRRFHLSPHPLTRHIFSLSNGADGHTLILVGNNQLVVVTAWPTACANFCHVTCHLFPPPTARGYKMVVASPCWLISPPPTAPHPLSSCSPCRFHVAGMGGALRGGGTDVGLGGSGGGGRPHR